MKNQILSLILIGAVSLQANASLEDSSQYYFNRGLEEKSARRYQSATKLFENAVKFNSNYAAAYLENAYANLEMKRINLAINNFEKVLELEPNNLKALNELASQYYNYRQYQKAISFAQKCGNCENSNRVIALSYFHLEDYVKAEPLLIAQVNQNPNDAFLNLTLARCFDLLDKNDKSAPFFQKAISLDPNKPEWMNEFAEINYDLGHFKDAVTYFEMAISHGYKVDNVILENLCFSYIYMNQGDKAEETLKTLLEKTGLKKDLVWSVIDAFYKTKNYDRVLDYLQKLLEADPKDAKALYQAGLCFQKKGQTDRGKAMCDKAIEMDPALGGLRRRESIGAGL